MERWHRNLVIVIGIIMIAAGIGEGVLCIYRIVGLLVGAISGYRVPYVLFWGTVVLGGIMAVAYFFYGSLAVHYIDKNRLKMKRLIPRMMLVVITVAAQVFELLYSTALGKNLVPHLRHAAAFILIPVVLLLLITEPGSSGESGPR